MESEEIEITVSDMMQSGVRELLPLLRECYIYKVPLRFLEINEKACKPKFVSIGPFHHGKEELKAMEDFKNRYLKEFLQHSKNPRVQQYLKVILENEEKLRNYYAENITLSGMEFTKMMFVDAIFLLMLMLKVFDPNRFIISSDDRMFTKPRMIDEVKYDILLLENQLPYFILDDLLKIFYEGVSISMIQLTHYFLKLNLPSLVKEDALEKHDFSGVKHFVDFLRICLLPTTPLLPPTKLMQISLPSITQLRQSGVKYKLNSIMGFWKFPR